MDSLSSVHERARENDGNEVFIAKMRIFITGGAGFIGSHILRNLGYCHEVKIYDIVNGDDVLDFENLKNKMNGNKIVVHCAAIAGIYRTAQNYAKTIDVDLIGTWNAVRAAKENKISLFINFSTSEVYGPMVYDGTEEEATTQGPISERRWAYAVSKLASEYIVANSGLPFITLRPFNIFGPGQIGEGAIRDIILKAIKGECITVYNDGTQIRSWCYISDFVSVIRAILEKPESWNAIYNIGNPQNTITVFNLAKKIIEMADSKSKIVFKPHPGPEVHVRVPNINKAKKILGFNPQVSLEEGLRRTIEFYIRKEDTR